MFLKNIFRRKVSDFGRLFLRSKIISTSNEEEKKKEKKKKKKKKKTQRRDRKMELIGCLVPIYIYGGRGEGGEKGKYYSHPTHTPSSALCFSSSLSFVFK